MPPSFLLNHLINKYFVYSNFVENVAKTFDVIPIQRQKIFFHNIPINIANLWALIITAKHDLEFLNQIIVFP